MIMSDTVQFITDTSVRVHIFQRGSGSDGRQQKWGGPFPTPDFNERYKLPGRMKHLLQFSTL